MGGLFGAVSNHDCVEDVFFGIDYHSHLGTSKGGMTVWNGKNFVRKIHSIENAPFRTKFENDLPLMSGNIGMGCISDAESQPITVMSRLGNFAIETVGRINNVKELVESSFTKHSAHFLEISDGLINPTELVASIIDNEGSYVEGIRRVQETIDGSCTILLLTPDGFIAARDRYGRTPLIVGEKEGTYCVASETCAFPNLGYAFKHEIGPGEILFVSKDGIEQLSPPHEDMKMCAFLWVYYGYPSSSYEGVNVELMRNRCGSALARRDHDLDIDLVAGIPDSGTAHAIGYANESKKPFGRPFVKYTPTWPRSFMPQEQKMRDLVARMKLIAVNDLIKGKKLLFCEDSIVRGTQLRETGELLFEAGASQLHVRAASPPLLFSCRYLNFSRNRSEMDLKTRRIIGQIEGGEDGNLQEYIDENSEKHYCMIDMIKKDLNLTSLKFQKLGDMLSAIGLPKEKICTYCWNGKK